jgi:hypothetical protein
MSVNDAEKPNEERFSFRDRSVEKSAAREQDEVAMESGEISRGEMSRRNGGGVKGVRYVGRSKRARGFLGASSVVAGEE